MCSSTASGARTTSATRRRSTCTSSASGPRSRRTRRTLPASSRSAASGIGTRSLGRPPPADGEPYASRLGLALLVPEIPLEDQALTFGVACDPFPVAPELRVVRWEQLEPRERPLPELVDEPPVAEHAVHLPVRRDGPQVHDFDVPLRRGPPQRP